jgi:hypothetical protein
MVAPVEQIDKVKTKPDTLALGDGGTATSLSEAQTKTNPKFKDVLRGDEDDRDAKVKNQADFGKLVDETADEYGLDRNQLRAQLEKESNAFSKGFEQAMKKEGDLDRAGDKNTSIGIGQISRKFLDGGEWSDDGPNNHRVGGKTVTSDQYNKSVTTQVRVAAGNLAQRIADNGGSLEKGLAKYVSGSTDVNGAQAKGYLSSIDANMKNADITDVGR